jgi:hypothetical protein
VVELSCHLQVLIFLDYKFESIGNISSRTIVSTVTHSVEAYLLIEIYQGLLRVYCLY